MSFKLFVSDDFGDTYSCKGSFESVEESEEVTNPLDPNIRWILEDKNGKAVDYCEIFVQVINQVRLELRFRHDGVAFATDDKKLAEVLKPLGVMIWSSDQAVAAATNADNSVEFVNGSHVAKELMKPFLH